MLNSLLTFIHSTTTAFITAELTNIRELQYEVVETRRIANKAIPKMAQNDAITQVAKLVRAVSNVSG